MYFFSAEMNSFYPEELKEEYIKAGTFPDDSILVGSDVFSEYSQNPPDGKMRGVKRGKPAWIDLPPPSKIELTTIARQKKAELSQEAENRITQLERKVRLSMASDEEAELLKAWEIYTVKLDDVNPDLAPEIEWPQKPE